MRLYTISVSKKTKAAERKRGRCGGVGGKKDIVGRDTEELSGDCAVAGD